MSEPSATLSPQEKEWISQRLGQFKFSSPLKNRHRDLSDGVLVAELLHQLFPRLVELHNYTKGLSITRKLDNWNTLNRKVFKKLEIELTAEIIDGIANGKQGAIDTVLLEIFGKVEQFGRTA